MEIEQKVMSRSEAERLTERIRHTANTFVEVKGKLSRFIQEAQDGRAHEALGYRSWTEYVAQVFSDTPLMQLSRDERRELVGELSESGMSTRAIAPIVGKDQSVVVRDRQVMQTPSPEPRGTFEVHSGGGFLNPGEEIEMHTTTTHDRETGEVVDERPYGEPSRVIGMDGKTYTRTEPAPVEPAKPKRSPLPQQFLNATVELRKCVERVERLVNDDRFPRNKNEIASLYESDLTRAVDSLNKSIAAFH